MWRKYTGSVVIAGILIAVLITGALSDNQEIIRAIKKGETISFLCIKIYGDYNEEIADLIKQSNKDIENLDVVRIGQRVKFPPLSKTKELPYSVKTSASRAVVTFLSGEALFLKSGTKDWRTLNPNDILTPGDKVKTGDNALVELVVNNADVMRLSSNTELHIEGISKAKREQPEAKFKFSVGKVWAKIKSYIERSGKFEVKFPTAIAAVQGTIYQAELTADSSATLKVYKGKVEVAEYSLENIKKTKKLCAPKQVAGPKQITMDRWVQIVREMQTLSFGPDKKPDKPQDFKESWQGEWEKFNKERDALFESN